MLHSSEMGSHEELYLALTFFNKQRNRKRNKQKESQPLKSEYYLLPKPSSQWSVTANVHISSNVENLAFPAADFVGKQVDNDVQ